MRPEKTGSSPKSGQTSPTSTPPSQNQYASPFCDGLTSGYLHGHTSVTVCPGHVTWVHASLMWSRDQKLTTWIPKEPDPLVTSRRTPPSKSAALSTHKIIKCFVFKAKLVTVSVWANVPNFTATTKNVAQITSFLKFKEGRRSQVPRDVGQHTKGPDDDGPQPQNRQEGLKRKLTKLWKVPLKTCSFRGSVKD